MIDKIKAEAQKLRDMVPEMFREEAYIGEETEELIPMAATHILTESRRPTMTRAFNKVSSTNATEPADEKIRPSDMNYIYT